MRKPSAKDPLGLEVIYIPPGEHKVDIIFVHGLGGGSRRTWSKDNNPDNFWPLNLLPLEAETNEARISTFGYDGTFNGPGTRNLMLFSDLSKDLLYNLKYASYESEQGKIYFGIGEVRPRNDIDVYMRKKV